MPSENCWLSFATRLFKITSSLSICRTTHPILGVRARVSLSTSVPIKPAISCSGVSSLTLPSAISMIWYLKSTYTRSEGIDSVCATSSSVTPFSLGKNLSIHPSNWVGSRKSQPPPISLLGSFFFTMFFQNFWLGFPLDALTNSFRMGFKLLIHSVMPYCSSCCVLSNTFCQSSGVPLRVMFGMPQAR